MLSFTFENVYGKKPKPTVDLDDVVDAAFEPEVGTPATPTGSLEHDLAAVIDAGEPAPVFPADEEVEDVAEVDDEQDWCQCSSATCREWRIVPKGTFLTFRNNDAKRFCRFSGATCQRTRRKGR